MRSANVRKSSNVLVVLIMTLFVLVLIIPFAWYKVLAESESAVFSDIEGHWGFDTIVWAEKQHIVQGYGDGTFGPDRNVTEAEFLTMLFNGFPEVVVPVSTQEPWYAGYYAYALGTMNWPVSLEKAGAPADRGQIARIVAATQGVWLNTDQSVQYLLDRKLANGKTAATVEGFGIESLLTRAEAVSFIKNLKNTRVTLRASVGGQPTAVAKDREFVLRGGIALGDSEIELIAQLGQPGRKDASEYGFTWYVYNQDYANYIQVGVQNGKVVGLYTNSLGWKSKQGVTIGSKKSEVEQQYGQSLESIRKGRANYRIMRDDDGLDVFLLDRAYTTIFYDIHQNDTVTAVQLIAEEVELALTGYYGKPSEELRRSYERQVLDLVNAVRVRMGYSAFEWADDAAAAARKHSDDMANNGYFDHTNLQGKSPFDRMDAGGIRYSLAGENIAAGQPSAIYAHEGWMNSAGHRKNNLGNFKRLGVGVGFGDPMHVYYTQNFYSPMK